MSPTRQASDFPAAQDPRAAAESEATAVMEAFLADLTSGRPVSVDHVVADHPDLSQRLINCLSVIQSLTQVSTTPPPPGVGPPKSLAQHTSPSGTRQLGEYCLVREIGCGGMGMVYEAEQSALGRRVALKILPFAVLASPQQRQRFQHEARIAATLSHPHIVSVYAVGSDRGIDYFAMQLVAGCSLARALEQLREDETQRSEGGAPNVKSISTRSQPSTTRVDADREEMSVEETDRDTASDAQPNDDREAGVRALLAARREPGRSDYFRKVARLGIQAAEALQYAHNQGVVHRDIKPGNLLIDGHEDVWITDFGLSRLTTEATATATGDLVGTLRYMTPEQVRSGHTITDPRADIYSLGATLYELLTLTPVVQGAERDDILNRIVSDAPVLPRSLDCAIPFDLETIVLKALEKDPDQRYPSAQTLASDLRCFLEDRPIRARRPSLADRLTKWSRRHRTLVAGAAAVMLLLTTTLATSTVLIWQARGRTQESLQQVQDVLYVRDMSLAFEAWEKSWTDEVRTIVRRHRPAPGEPDRRGFEWYLLNAFTKQSAPLVLRGHRGAVSEVAVFPDRSRIASVGDDGIVRIWNLADGQLISQIVTGDEMLSAVAVSPCGKMLATGRYTVRLWDVASGQKIRDLTAYDKITVESIAFSPDGMLVASGSRYADVRVMSLDGTITLQVQTNMRNESLAFSADSRQLLTPFEAGRAGDTHGAVRVLDLATGKPYLDVALPRLPSLTLGTFDAAGTYIAVACRRGAYVALVHPETGHVIAQLPEQRSQLNAMATSPSGRQLAVACNSGLITIWRFSGETPAVCQNIQAHDGVASCVRFVDEQRLVSSGSDGTVKVWRSSIAQNAVPFGLTTHFALSGELAISPNGRQLAMLDNNRHLWLGDLQGGEGTLLRVPDAVSGYGQAAAYSTNGDCLAVCCSKSKLISLWDPNQKQVLGTLEADALGVNTIVFSPSGDFLASTGDDAKLRVWQLADHREVQRLDLPHHGWTLAFSPRGELLASGGRFPEILIWDTATWQIRMRLATGSTIEDLAYSPDGRILASADSDAHIGLWDAASGRLLATLAGHEDVVGPICFSPDGKTLVSGSGDGTVRLWSVPQRCEFGTIMASDSGSTVAFAPQGRKLVIGFVGRLPETGKNLLLWDIDDTTDDDETDVMLDSPQPNSVPGSDTEANAEGTDLPPDVDRGASQEGAEVPALPQEDQAVDAGADDLPPTLVATRPGLSPGVLLAGTSNLELRLNEALSAPIDLASYQLQSAGADGLLGTPDDTFLPLLADVQADRLVLSCLPLNEGIYRLTLRGRRRGDATGVIDDAEHGADVGDFVRDFVVDRWLTTLDPTFGQQGVQLLDFGRGLRDEAECAAVQPDGKLIVAGTCSTVAGRDVGLLRLLPDGQPDVTFGNSGFVTIDLGSASDAAYDVVWADEPQRIVVAGVALKDGRRVAALVLLRPDGSLDTTSENGGIICHDYGVGADADAYSLGIQGNGKITTVGRARYGGAYRLGVSRFLVNGARDPSLDVNLGGRLVDMGMSVGHGMLFQPDQKLVVGGLALRGHLQFAVSRYSADGSSDAEFGTTGMAITDFGGDADIGSVVLQTDGKLLASGIVFNGTDQDFAFVRYLPNGALDSTFGTAGRLQDDVDPETTKRPAKLALLADGRFVAAGDALDRKRPGFLLFGYSADGSRDPTFGQDGRIRTPVGQGPARLSDLVQDRCGRLVAVGASPNLQSKSQDFAVVRYGAAPVQLVSAQGHVFDVDIANWGAGQLVQGGDSNAFDGLLRLQVDGKDYAVGNALSQLDDGGQTVVTPTVSLSKLKVHREITVPNTGTESFARTLEVLENPTTAPITTTVRLLGNLGSDGATCVFADSNGNLVLEPTDTWFGTDDEEGRGSPPVVHYLHSPSGLAPTSLARTGDNLEWSYTISIEPNQTVRLAHFTILHDTRVGAQAAADALVTPNGFGNQAAMFLTPDELTSLVNFRFASPPAPTTPSLAELSR